MTLAAITIAEERPTVERAARLRHRGVRIELPRFDDLVGAANV